MLIGFIGTLQSVSTDDIDGLNFIPNVVFGLPWNLAYAPIGWILGTSSNVYLEAVIDFLVVTW